MADSSASPSLSSSPEKNVSFFDFRTFFIFYFLLKFFMFSIPVSNHSDVMSHLSSFKVSCS